MGLIVDTNVFIQFERSNTAMDLSSWGPLGPVFISTLTASELLIGVHRADTEVRRERRSAFVEAILSGIGILDFTLGCARIHAEVCSTMAKSGQSIGAHDLIIAATARYHDFPILTDNVSEFSRVPGLQVIPFA